MKKVHIDEIEGENNSEGPGNNSEGNNSEDDPDPPNIENNTEDSITKPEDTITKLEVPIAVNGQVGVGTGMLSAFSNPKSTSSKDKPAILSAEGRNSTGS